MFFCSTRYFSVGHLLPTAQSKLFLLAAESCLLPIQWIAFFLVFNSAMHSSRNMAQLTHNNVVFWISLRSGTWCKRKGFLHFSYKKLPKKWKWAKSVGFPPLFFNAVFTLYIDNWFACCLPEGNSSQKKMVEFLEKGAPVSEEWSTMTQEKILKVCGITECNLYFSRFHYLWIFV